MLQIGNKMEKWQCPHNLPTWHHRQVFFDVVLFFLSSLVTGPSFMSISSLVLELWQFLTRNPKIGYNPVWVLPNVWGQGRIRDTKLGANASNEMLSNVAKCQGHSFYRFWVIKGKPTEMVKLYKTKRDTF